MNPGSALPSLRLTAHEIERGTLSVTEAAQRLGISRAATVRAAVRGEIPAIRIGRRWLVLRGPLEALLRAATPVEREARM